MNQKVLKTKAVYRAQTGTVVAEETGGILDEFGVRSRVAVITVDHAAKMNVAVHMLHLVKIGCFAHTLNLGAQSVYTVTSVAKWTSKIRDVIVWMKRPTMAKTQREATDSELARVTDEDIRKAEDFVQLMRVMYTSTLCVSTEKSPTCSQILPILQNLKEHFTVHEGDTAFVSTLKTTVWSDLSQRYQLQKCKKAKVTPLEELFAEDDALKKNQIQGTLSIQEKNLQRTGDVQGHAAYNDL